MRGRTQMNAVLGSLKTTMLDFHARSFLGPSSLMPPTLHQRQIRVQGGTESQSRRETGAVEYARKPTSSPCFISASLLARFSPFSSRKSLDMRNTAGTVCGCNSVRHEGAHFSRRLGRVGLVVAFPNKTQEPSERAGTGCSRITGEPGTRDARAAVS